MQKITKLDFTAEDIVFVTTMGMELYEHFNLKPSCVDELLFGQYVCRELLNFIKFLHQQKYTS